jgi:flagellar hook-associated protein 1
MSDLLGIGTSAIGAYRTALNAIGQNVANSETPGYARRDVRLRDATASTTSPIYNEAILFGGVRAGSITRAWDNFRAADSRYTASTAGRTEGRKTWLTAVETALNDGPSGVGQTMGKFFNAGVTLGSEPGDTLGRRSMLMALEDTAGSFRTTAESLARVSGGLGDTASLETDRLNQDLSTLAKINTQLRQAAPDGSTRAGLEDDRDRLLDSVAERVGIEVSYKANGTATVTLANSGGSVLVDERGAKLMQLAKADDGRLSFSLIGDGEVTPLALSAGKLSGLAEAAAVTADRRSALDALAADFAASVNSWSAAGRTPAGTAGGPLLEVTAGAASIRVLTTDPAAIAAASADGKSNGNLLALGDLRGTDGAEAKWSNTISGHALMLASAQSEHAAASSRRETAFGARDEVSGVDLDYEAAELMRYQQAYSGAARIIQVARDTTQAILDLF